jgi:hypothetical protein
LVLEPRGQDVSYGAVVSVVDAARADIHNITAFTKKSVK